MSDKKHEQHSGFYFSDQDYTFIQQINEEFIEDVVNTPIYLYKVEEEETETNLYGEGEGGDKVYHPPVQIYAFIEPQDQETDQQNVPVDFKQRVQVAFQRERLKDKDVYPEQGDVFEWGENFFEIKEMVDNQLLADKWYYRQSVVCQAALTRPSNLNIVDEDKRI